MCGCRGIQSILKVLIFWYRTNVSGRRRCSAASQLRKAVPLSSRASKNGHPVVWDIQLTSYILKSVSETLRSVFVILESVSEIFRSVFTILVSISVILRNIFGIFVSVSKILQSTFAILVSIFVILRSVFGIFVNVSEILWSAFAILKSVFEILRSEITFLKKHITKLFDSIQWKPAAPPTCRFYPRK